MPMSWKTLRCPVLGCPSHVLLFKEDEENVGLTTCECGKEKQIAHYRACPKNWQADWLFTHLRKVHNLGA